MSNFQWIVDNATSLTVDSRSIVASTTTRSGITRSIERGGQPWVFTVLLPDGPRWTEYRQAIALAEARDKHTQDTINFSANDLGYIYSYQGDLDTTTLSGSWSLGAKTCTITGAALPGAQYHFRAGDLVQLGTNGYVYKVAQDNPVPGGPVSLHRPIIEAGSGTVTVGQDVSFTVKCVEFPRWNIFGYNQVAWDGPFVFVEVIE